MLKMLFIVSAGSFVGGLRFYLQKIISNNITGPFPMGIFLINILGCFLIGFFYGISNKYNVLTETMRIFLTTGICGGFTTFSTFSNESLQLFNTGNYSAFFLYTVLSVVLGIFATFIGYLIFK